jgi:hypothetical protein
MRSARAGELRTNAMAATRTLIESAVGRMTSARPNEGHDREVARGAGVTDRGVERTHDEEQHGEDGEGCPPASVAWV